MAIAFLQDDPPLLFRATIVDKMEQAMGNIVPYNIDQPFAAPSNQKSMAHLKETIGRDIRHD